MGHRRLAYTMWTLQVNPPFSAHPEPKSLGGGGGGVPRSDIRANKVVISRLKHHTPYSARMSPENTHTLKGFYMEVLILGVIL